ncbi:MAG TPA: tol-pal system protein YbgF [Vicinamibacterales bacterium]|nr:tol-pal system protein YbgF [Vicinamibacterales bacterium]
MKRTAALATACALAFIAITPARAADREHRVMMAELRMLQEQTQQLQQMLNGLNETLKTLNAKIDDESGVTRKAFADQRLLIENLGQGVRIVREKVDETNVRIATLSQDVEAIRTTAMAPPQIPIPGAPDQPPMPGAPDANTPAATGTTPKQLFDLAQGDYSAGQWDLAIQGFQTYLKTYPRSPMAPEAALYIGQAHYAAGRFKEAVEAYDTVIASYPGTQAVAQAYYKRGLSYERLGQIDRARESLEAVIKNFPDTNEVYLAKQALERLNKP